MTDDDEHETLRELKEILTTLSVSVRLIGAGLAD